MSVHASPLYRTTCVDSRMAFRAFLATHGAAIHEYAVALADFNKRLARELEQEALIELWTLDPSRYASADWPYLVEAARRTMRKVRSRFIRARARRRHGDRRANNGRHRGSRWHAQPTHAHSMRYMLRAEREIES